MSCTEDSAGGDGVAGADSRNAQQFGNAGVERSAFAAGDTGPQTELLLLLLQNPLESHSIAAAAVRAVAAVRCSAAAGCGLLRLRSESADRWNPSEATSKMKSKI